MFDEMVLIIKGMATRIASTVNDWIRTVTSTGVDPIEVRRKLDEEIEMGRIITEMKNFAIASVPGYTGKLIQRFADDTLRDLINKKRAKGFQYDPAGVYTQENYGINTDGYDRELHVIKPISKAVMLEMERWITMDDNKVCPNCIPRHNKFDTYRNWLKRGIPPYYRCYGTCRCKLVPSLVVGEDDVPDAIILPKQPKFTWFATLHGRPIDPATGRYLDGKRENY